MLFRCPARKINLYLILRGFLDDDFKNELVVDILGLDLSLIKISSGCEKKAFAALLE